MHRLFLITCSTRFLYFFNIFFVDIVSIGKRDSSLPNISYASDLLEKYRVNILIDYKNFLDTFHRSFFHRFTCFLIGVNNSQYIFSSFLFNGENFFKFPELNNLLLLLASIHHRKAVSPSSSVFIFIPQPYLYLSYFLTFRINLSPLPVFLLFHYLYALFSLCLIILHTPLSVLFKLFSGFFSLFYYFLLNFRFLFATSSLHNNSTLTSDVLLITYGSPLVDSSCILQNRHLGHLPFLLNKNNLNFDILFIDINSKFFKLLTSFDKYIHFRSDPRLLNINFSSLSLHCSLIILLRAFSLFITTALKGIFLLPFIFYSALSSNSYFEILLVGLTNSFFGSSLAINILYSLTLRSFFRNRNYSSVFIASEGQFWEKSIYKIFENSNTKIVSYPHLPIKPWDLRLLTHYSVCKLYNLAKPDFILCNSSSNYDFFKNYFAHQYLYSEVESLQFNSTIPPAPNLNADSSFYDLLILGDYSTTISKEMLSVVFKCISELPYTSIIYKPHPSSHYIPRKYPGNCRFIVKSDSIEELSSKCRFIILPSTSSAVVNCLLCGRPPLIFNNSIINPSLVSISTYPFFFTYDFELYKLLSSPILFKPQLSNYFAFISPDYSLWSSFLVKLYAS